MQSLITLLVATLFAVAHASPSQFWNPASTAYEASITAMSPKCRDALNKVYADKELDRCLNFSGQNNFTHLFFDNAQNKSVVDNAAIFASQTLCVRPACSEASVSSNLHLLNTACTPDDLNRDKSPAGFLVAGLNTYGVVRSEACLTNTTSFYKSPDSSFNGHPFCFQQLATGVQQTKGVNFDLPNLTLLLKMDKGLLTRIFRAPESDLNRKSQQQAFCTDCLKASYELVKDMMDKTNKVALVGAVNSLCGKDFLNDKDAFPKSVEQSEAKSIPAVGGGGTGTGTGTKGGNSTNSNSSGDVDESGSSASGSGPGTGSGTSRKPSNSSNVITANTTGAGADVVANSTTPGTPQDPTKHHADGAGSVRVETGLLLEVVLLGILFVVGAPLLA